jgi:hypothetical protein
MQSACLDRRLDQLVDAVLDDWRLTLVDRGDFARVGVDTDHLVTEFGQACA